MPLFTRKKIRRYQNILRTEDSKIHIAILSNACTYAHIHGKKRGREKKGRQEGGREKESDRENHSPLNHANISNSYFQDRTKSSPNV